jgi:hypothetical protein
MGVFLATSRSTAFYIEGGKTNYTRVAYFDYCGNMPKLPKSKKV